MVFMGLEFYSKGVKKIVAVAAGKGGVGKSTVAVQLARSLRDRGYAVGILDADVYGPSVRHMLPEDEMPYQEGDRVIPAISQGIKVISVAYFNQGHAATIVRAPIANGIVENFLNQVDWGDLDYLLIDFPPGTGDVQLTLMQQVDFFGAVIVTTPQEVALLDVMKATEMFMQMNIEVLGVIENMSYYIDLDSGKRLDLFGFGGAERICDAWGLELLGQVPIDPRLSKENLASDETIFATLAGKLEGHRDSERPTECEMVLGGEKLKLGGDEVTLSDVQRGCPCMRCQTGERSVADGVRATALRPVGRYGVKINFSSGCSRGIYAYQYLRQFV